LTSRNYIDILSSMIREFRKGSTSLLLLHLLTERPMYGFELSERLHASTGGLLAFKEGTLYPALHGLEADGLVESFWEESPDGPRRRYYRITSRGRAALVERRVQWALLVEAVNGALGTRG
jgi:PadR family transcriptional regulator PadR